MNDQTTNIINPEKVKKHFGAVEGYLDQLDRARAEYMSECKGIREGIKTAKERAIDDGIPAKAFSLELKSRILDRRKKALRDGADPEDVELADMLRVALGDSRGLGDTPLAAAAIDAAEKQRGGRSAALNSLIGDEAVSALQGGIRQL